MNQLSLTILRQNLALKIKFFQYSVFCYNHKMTETNNALVCPLVFSDFSC